MGCRCRDLSGVGDRGGSFPVAGKFHTARTTGALLEGATCWSYGSAGSTPSDATISLISFTNALRKGVMPEGTELLAPELIVRRSTAPALQTLTSPGQGRKIKGAVNPSKEVHRHAAFGVHTD
jgi:hypothetical protein